MRPHLSQFRFCRMGMLIFALTPEHLAGQSRIQGTVRDSLQGTPLPLVEVAVDGMNLSTRTDAQGQYALTLPLGFHTVLFRRIGYHPITRRLRLSNADSVRLDVTMLDEAQRLAPIEVEEPAPPRTWPPGLDNRLKDGYGQFVMDSTIRKFEHSTVSNLLQSQTTGVRFKRLSGRNVAFSGRGPRMMGGMGGAMDCYFSIWLDGILLYEPGDGAPGPRNSGGGASLPPDLDRYAVVGLEAIEVYHPAQLPSQYRGGNSACGVILLWSRTQRN